MPGLLMRGLRFYVDHDHGTGPDFPALRLFAEVMLDAVNLVRGVRHANATLPARSAEAAAARAWIRDGNVGVLSFNDCCGYLGMDAENVRRAIFSPPRGPDARSSAIDARQRPQAVVLQLEEPLWVIEGPASHRLTTLPLLSDLRDRE
jgi:hypothetical protein